MLTAQNLIALNAAPRLSRDFICRLARGIADPVTTATGTTAADLAARTGLPTRRVTAVLRDLRQAASRAHRQRQLADRHDMRIVTWLDSDYPPALHDLPLPPPVLYLRGALPAAPCLSIVGSRRTNPYGLEAAELFGRQLAAAGLTVVSGLARGVDAAAHRGALAADGRTVAVLGCGLDRIYPRGHARLADRISDTGGLLSEFPFGTPPLRHHFPIRNRLIAALGSSTLVVQAALRSGSLITAGLALELGRQVWAVPGGIFDARSAGANRLLRDGAAPALTPCDLLESLPEAVRSQLPSASPPQQLELPADELAASVLTAIVPGTPRTPDEIAIATGSSIQETLSALAALEIAGCVHRYPGPVFTRAT